MSTPTEQEPLLGHDEKIPPPEKRLADGLNGQERSNDLRQRLARTRWWRRLGFLLGLSTRALRGTAELEKQLIFSLNPKRWPSLKQLRHSARIFSKWEKRTLAVCLIVILTSTIWLTINRALVYFTFAPKPGGSYSEALIGQPKFLNPVFAATSAVDTDLTRLLFSGLFRYNEKLEIEPDLADSYDRSEDGRAYTVKLRDGLVWHDGEPVTVDDAVFTFASIVDPDIGSPLKPSWRGIAVEKIDDRTIRFTLKDPYVGFLDLLTIGLIPQHIWDEIPTAQWRERGENLQPVGNGPWQFNSMDREANGYIKSYVINRAADANGHNNEAAPFLEHLTFKFYPDENQALAALGERNVEGSAFLTDDDVEQLRGNKHLKLHELRLQADTAIFFNLNQSSPIQDVIVRRALRSAVDKRRLVLEKLPTEASVIHGPAGVSSFGKLIKDTTAARYQTEETEKLLTQAGWKRVGAIRQNSKGEMLNLTLTVIDREPDKGIGQFIQEQWREVGVETKIDLVSPPTPDNIQRAILRPRAYEALLYTTAYGATYDPYPFWHSSQRVDPGLNLSLFSNHEADAAIERGRRALDAETQRRAYAELQKIIFNEVPAIFLFAPIRFYAVSDNVRDISIDTIAVPADRFNGLNKWHVKTKIRFKW